MTYVEIEAGESRNVIVLIMFIGHEETTVSSHNTKMTQSNAFSRFKMWLDDAAMHGIVPTYIVHR